ncbi:MAG: hypothetical protein U5K43_14175 [Halofilum sp. (in: g-proteobacteria)]|nr:hypothetical protein [Halofilum sp. (in: g-proteobacteria)]
MPLTVIDRYRPARDPPDLGGGHRGAAADLCSPTRSASVLGKVVEGQLAGATP